MPLDHREWSMQEISRRESLRDHVTRLHKLERELVRVRVCKAATHDDTVFHEHVPLNELGYRRLLFERAGDEFRNGFIRKLERVSGQLRCEHIKEEHLARESFCR